MQYIGGNNNVDIGGDMSGDMSGDIGGDISGDIDKLMGTN